MTGETGELPLHTWFILIICFFYKLALIPFSCEDVLKLVCSASMNTADVTNNHTGLNCIGFIFTVFIR